MGDGLERIQELIGQLGSLGYHSYQIRNIIKETVNQEKLGDLSNAERERLIAALQHYVDFARKSLNG